MKKDLTGKVIIITGASSGIGEHMALMVAKKGAIPVLIARTEEKLKQLSKKISEQTGIEAPVYPLDISQTDAIPDIFSDIVANLGKIDILVNNAGFGQFAELQHADFAKIKDMFAVNVLGLIACTKAALPYLIEQNQGHIINIASLAGKLGTPKSSGYSASKHAVLGFTNSLRLELSDTNIFVSAVNPGPIKTGFFDLADQSGQYVKNVEKYMLDPEDVAEKIVQLMSHPKRELNVPGWMNAGSVLYQLLPSLVETIGGKAFKMK